MATIDAPAPVARWRESPHPHIEDGRDYWYAYHAGRFCMVRVGPKGWRSWHTHPLLDAYGKQRWRGRFMCRETAMRWAERAAEHGGWATDPDKPVPPDCCCSRCRPRPQAGGLGAAGSDRNAGGVPPDAGSGAGG